MNAYRDGRNDLRGGVFKHYKKGNIYLVLLVAETRHVSPELVEGSDVSVTWGFGGFYVETPMRNLEFSPCEIFRACYTGSRPPRSRNLSKDGELLVVYVGLYDNPHGNRVCCRPLAEWEEEGLMGELVKIPCYKIS